MIVLDAYALAALLADEPAAAEVAELMGSGPVVVPAPNLAEAADVLGRAHGIETARTRAAVESLQEAAGLRVRSVGEAEAWRAAELRIVHYHRSKRPLSLGDCLLLGATRGGERLASADPHVLDAARAEGLDWLALLDSRGRRHRPRA